MSIVWYIYIINFNEGKHDKCMQILKKTKINNKDTRIIDNLLQQMAVFRKLQITYI